LFLLKGNAEMDPKLQQNSEFPVIEQRELDSSLQSILTSGTTYEFRGYVRGDSLKFVDGFALRLDDNRNFDVDAVDKNGVRAKSPETVTGYNFVADPSDPRVLYLCFPGKSLTLATADRTAVAHIFEKAAEVAQQTAARDTYWAVEVIDA